MMEQEWSSLTAHPAFQSGAVPLGLAWVLTGLLRGGRLGGAPAIGIALLASAVLLVGLPTQPPFSAVQKLVLLLSFGVLLGLIVQLLSVSTPGLRAIAVGLFLGASLWLAWPQLRRDTLSWEVTVVALVCGALLYVLARHERRSAEEGVELILFASGLAGIAAVSGSLLIAQLASALALASLGFLAWNWPRARPTPRPSMLLGAWLPAFALAVMTPLLTTAPPYSLSPLIVVLFLAPMVRQLWAPSGRLREALPTLYLLILGCLPVALAVAMALLVESPDDAYYR